MSKTLHVNLGKNSYDIIIEKGLINRASEEIKKVYKGNKIFIITDDIVAGLYLDKVIENLKEFGYL